MDLLGKLEVCNEHACVPYFCLTNAYIMIP